MRGAARKPPPADRGRSLLKRDPSRSVTLRRQMASALRRQFSRLKGKVVALVLAEDAFNLAGPPARAVANTFCPTGEGGGVDPSCSPGGGAADAPYRQGSGSGTLYARRRGAGEPPGAVSDAAQVEREQYLERVYGPDHPFRERFPGEDDPGLDRVAKLAYDVLRNDLPAGRDLSVTWNDSPDYWAADLWSGTALLAQVSRNAGGLRVEAFGGFRRTAKNVPEDATDREAAALVHRGLGVQTPAFLRGDTPTANTRWRFSTDPEKLAQFRQWLSAQFASTLTGASEEALWQRYVEQGYRRGAGRAFDDVKRRERALAAGDRAKVQTYDGTREAFLRDSFARPVAVAVEKVQLLAGRAFDELEGVTEQMGVRMGRVLADGLVQGQSPGEVARALAAEVDVGRDRAEVISRTELLRAHNEGQLTALEALGVEEVGVAVEWVTSGLNVCPRCAALEGVVLTIDEARGMIPLHPNCMCAWVPANVGEDDAGQKRSRGEIDDALAEAGVDDVDVAADRPGSVLNAGHGPALEAFSRWLAANTFCPTGEGGGVDPTCSPGGGGGAAAAPAAHDPGARPAPPPGGWRDDAHIAEHAAKVLAAHDADPHVRGLHGKLAEAEAAHAAAQRELPNVANQKPYKELLADAAAAYDRLKAVREAIAHEERRSFTMGFYVPREDAARFTGYYARSTTPQAKGWEAAKGHLELVSRKDAVGDQRVGVASARSRAEYDHGTIRTTKTDGPEVSAHEFGHHLEETAWVRERASEFRAARFDPKDDAPMSALAPHSGYAPDEVGNPDRMHETFRGNANLAAYAGKTYPGGRTEIVSMGLQKLHSDPLHFARADPEFFSLIVGILQRGPKS